MRGKDVSQNMNRSDLQCIIALLEAMEEQCQILVSEASVEQTAETKTDEAALANRGFVAADGRDDEVVEHCHESDVGLKIAFHVLQHALCDM